MANYTIANASNIPLDARSGTIPNMRDALKNWFQYLTFSKVTKSVEAFQAVETREDISFWGLIQVYTDKQLLLKPEGQRSWSWFKVFAQAEPAGAVIQLDVDDIIFYRGVQTRVMALKEWALHSYIEYDWVQDWEVSPGVVTP